MFKMIAHLSYGVQEYVCDSYADLAELSKNCDLGDKCYVIDENAIYIMNSAKEWKKIGGTVMPTVGDSTLGVTVLGDIVLGG